MMKKNLLFSFFAFFMLTIMSCKDDNDTYFITDADLNGVYMGMMDIDAPLGDINISVKDTKQKIYITKTNENLVKLELKNFVFSYEEITIPIGDIIVENIKVNKEGGNFNLSGIGNQILSVGPCNVTVEGVITATGACDMNIGVKVTGETPMDVHVKFRGNRANADKSSEAKILEFTFDTKLVTSKPMILGNQITFMVTDTITSEELTKLVPTIQISDRATVSPASGSAQDFTNPVIYTVTSEDGITTQKYTVKVTGKITTFDFEEWNQFAKYSEPDGWATSNGGSTFLQKVAIKDTIPHSGKLGVVIKTFDTNGNGNLIPKITTGSLFLGVFKLNYLDALASTKFGIEYHKKPLSVKGFYQYTPGEKYFYCADPAKKKGTAVVDPNKVDSCSISAVLYEVSAFTSSEYLTGHNIYTATDKIVAIAQLEDGSARTDWTEFEIKLNYLKPYDPTKLYRFAVICSSSKYGDKFSGAPDSKLLVDDFEIISE